MQSEQICSPGTSQIRHAVGKSKSNSPWEDLLLYTSELLPILNIVLIKT